MALDINSFFKNTKNHQDGLSEKSISGVTNEPESEKATIGFMFQKAEQQTNKSIEVLKNMGIKEARIREALSRHVNTKEPLPEIMRDFGFLSPEKVARALAHIYDMDYTAPEVINHIDIQAMQKYEVPFYKGVVPIAEIDGSLVIGVSSPEKITDAKNEWYNFKPKVVIASENTIQAIFRQVYSKSEQGWDQACDAFSMAMKRRANDVDADPNLLRNVFTTLIRHACYIGASDIHMYRTTSMGVINLRLDGVGTLFRSIPVDLTERLLQKISTDCNISMEQLILKPQEAVYNLDAADTLQYPDIANRYNFRIELAETPRGKAATIRILDRQASATDIEKLHFNRYTLSSLLRYVNTSEGLVIVTGPTGSGKTTSLYALLNEIDPVERSVQTIENPVEYTHGLWRQHEISKRAENESSASLDILKGLLRNDPDVMLIGEIRDSKTAEVMLNSANTGHLCFTTLHSNSASGALTRLQNMGMDMPSLSSVLLGVLSQRLVRVLCNDCKKPDERKETASAIEPIKDMVDEMKPHIPCGCPNCLYTGYRGRRIIYELLDVNAEIRAMIERKDPISMIKAKGIQTGHDIRSCGMKLVAEGITSMDEIRRVTKEG